MLDRGSTLPMSGCGWVCGSKKLAQCWPCHIRARLGTFAWGKRCTNRCHSHSNPAKSKLRNMMPNCPTCNKPATNLQQSYIWIHFLEVCKLSGKATQRCTGNVQSCAFMLGNDLAMTWQWLGNDLAMTWQWLGNDLAMTWQWLGNDLAMTWQNPSVSFAILRNTGPFGGAVVAPQAWKHCRVWYRMPWFCIPSDSEPKLQVQVFGICISATFCHFLPFQKFNSKDEFSDVLPRVRYG